MQSKLLVLFLFFSLNFYGQESLDRFFYLVDMGKYQEARKQLSRLPAQKEFEKYLEIHENGCFPNEESTDTYSSLSIDKNLQLLLKGLTVYLEHGEEVEAIDFLNQSLRLSKLRGDKVLTCWTLRYLLEIYERFNTVINDISYKDYIKQLKLYAFNERQKSIAILFEYRIGQRYNYRDNNYNLTTYPKFRKLLKNSFDSPFLKAKRDLTHFVHHLEFSKNLDSSSYYLTQVFKSLELSTGFFENERLIAAQINKASYFNELGDADIAISLLDSLNISKINGHLFRLLESYYYLKKADAFLIQKDSLAHCRNLVESYLIDFDITQGKNARIVSGLATKFQTAEKEKQILEEQQKVRTNRNWLIAAGIVLLLGAGIALLLQKNTTKKRLLAEKETLLKQERVDNLLKEQELVSIDAMIEGQEKERQRVANELHDDLGSLMATIKLHFDNSKISKKDPALKNAQKLLDEAYQKVRGMAHSKNSGVMSDQGLLPAIKKMAQVITETNALEVVVEDFGMGDRLENSLELNLFRMVQELVANAIKHAEASKVSIQLTQHDDNLNIIVEDNGKGFDRSTIETGKTGMGLTTIEKRVEHLEGNFTVDSILGKGTSILIDIPV